MAVADPEDSGSDAEEAAAAGLLEGTGAVVTSQLTPGQMATVDEAGLQQALEEMELSHLDWEERLDVTSAEPASIPDVNDDLQRELAFYNQALAAVYAARGELERRGVPYYRPRDYFAEMLKSDAHMSRVKARLIAEQRRMDAVEQRKREKESRVYAKQVQAERLKQKAQEKKRAIESVSQWRKKRRREASGGNVAASASDAAKELQDVLSTLPGPKAL